MLLGLRTKNDQFTPVLRGTAFSRVLYGAGNRAGPPSNQYYIEI